MIWADQHIDAECCTYMAGAIFHDRDSKSRHLLQLVLQAFSYNDSFTYSSY